MDYLYELTLKHRELIEKKLAELNTKDFYIRCGCTSTDDCGSIIKLLSSSFFELVSNEKQCGEIGEELCLKEVQSWVLRGNDYKTLIFVLNNIKNIIRDIAFEIAKDKSELYRCVLAIEKSFEHLQMTIFDSWNAIEKNDGLLRSIFDILPFGAFIYGENRFTHVNSVGERLTGYSASELNSMGIKELMHRDFYHLLTGDIKNWQSESGIKIRRFECRILNKNGNEVWVDISVGHLKMGGKPCLLATALDITDRKKIENSLYKSERKYRTFFNFSPDMIYLIDVTNGYIEEANPMMLNSLGVTLEEIRAMKLKDFYAGGSIDEVNSALDCLMDGKEVKGLEIKAKNVYGEPFDLEANCTPIIENGKVIKILCQARNITERKKMEELKKQALETMKLLNETLEYDKQKTEFFSNLSHELRTPLNVILGTLQVMDMFNHKDQNFTEEKMKKYSKIMRQNCYRLLRLVNNLIDLNKLDTGYMNLNMDNHDIVSIISQIASSVTDYIENKGIYFSFKTEISSKVIACDPDKMERIILNLLSNAVKFTGCGGEIHVKLWAEKEGLFISVRDTGIGIPKDKQDVVFKRFVQIDKSLSRIYQGSGIGLSLVRSLVELHGGSIWLISEEGSGSEFIIELPTKQAVVTERSNENPQYTSNNRIETINIEFADIYS